MRFIERKNMKDSINYIQNTDYKLLSENEFNTKKEAKCFYYLVELSIYSELNCENYDKSIYIEIYNTIAFGDFEEAISYILDAHSIKCLSYRQTIIEAKT